MDKISNALALKTDRNLNAASGEFRCRGSAEGKVEAITVANVAIRFAPLRTLAFAVIGPEAAVLGLIDCSPFF
jgi:hypothetical protein